MPPPAPSAARRPQISRLLETPRGLSVLATLLALVVVPTAGLAQEEDFSQKNTSDINSTARMLTSSRRYQEAVPALEELIKRFEETSDPAHAGDLKSAYLYLGVGRMTGNDFSGAVSAFEAMEERFPKDTLTRLAVDLRGDCQSHLGNYDAAIAAWRHLMDAFTLEPSFRQETLEKLGDALMAAERWQEAADLLEPMFASAPIGLAKARLAGDLVRCNIELGRFDAIAALVPFLDDFGAQVRTSLDFNLTLIRGGDRMFEEGRHLEALLLYQLVYPLEKIREVLEARRESLGSRRVALLKSGDADLRTLVALGTRVARTEQELEALEGVEPFTPEINLRLARLYTAMNRPFEAIWAFSETWHQSPDHPAAERGLRAAAVLAGEAGLDDKALAHARACVENFPEGEFFGEMVRLGGQVLLRSRRWQECIAWTDAHLDENPDLSCAADLLFFRGFSRFQGEDFEGAVADYEASLAADASDENRERIGYWLPLTRLFMGEIGEARGGFETYLSEFPGGTRVEDVRFRIAASSYGLGEFPRARRELDRYLADFPGGMHKGEAHNLLGDIAGAEGRSGDAIREFSLAARSETSMEAINYATFKRGEILEQLGRWQESLDLFQDYLKTHGLDGRHTEAMWRIGLAHSRLGHPERMLETYRKAIAEHADKREAVGMDLILDDWVRERTTMAGAPPVKELRTMLDDASDAGSTTAALRYLRALDMSGNPPKQPFDNSDIEAASPAVLLWIAEQSKASNRPLAMHALEKIRSDFAGTEWLEPALLQIAILHEEDGDTPSAITACTDLFERFPRSPRAGEALARKADLLEKEGRDEEALETLETVLAVKEYKGPLWPRALVRTGEILEKSGRTEEAFAYYQRVYVLYGHYADWTARAYLRSGRVLENLGKTEEAARTYSELLDQERLSDFDEFHEAKKRLAELP
jgi:tetratricopeptide (TPR) repeat protein